MCRRPGVGAAAQAVALDPGASADERGRLGLGGDRPPAAVSIRGSSVFGTKMQDPTM